MLFKDCQFRDKTNVRKQFKEAIVADVKKEIPFNKCNDGRVFEYIDFLLDESEYSIGKNQFYYKVTWVKIWLPVSLFVKVAVEYINEHLDYFLLEKHK